MVKQEVIQQLRQKILVMQGFKEGCAGEVRIDVGLGDMQSAFPGGVFPIGAVHEFVSPTAACATASNGFISGVLSTLTREGTPCLWVSTRRSIFPPALKFFGVEPHQVIFVDVRRDKDVLWVMEQGLKCASLAAVIGELDEVSFAASQRLQLAVEKSQVTGFLHRRCLRRPQPLACVSRWRVRPLPSTLPEGMPGIGYPVWEVQLEKIRNGRPGTWSVEWQNGKWATADLHKEKPLVHNGERYA